MKVGMTIKQAIFYNILSSILSFNRMVIGILLGTISSPQDMLLLTPSPRTGRAGDTWWGWCCRWWGMGMAMLVIALYDDGYVLC